LGLWPIRKTIESVNEMPIPEQERQKIYSGNARRLLHLNP